jgi:GNAT superfamily N-acetyltransferase
VIGNPAVTVQPVVTPNGILSTRPEAPADDGFLFTLFESVKGPDFAELPDPLKVQLLRMQYDAMRQSYRTSFATSAFNIVMMDDAPIGSLITNATNDCISVVYIALLPVWRRRGISSALMRLILFEARTRDLSCEATVAVDNIASLCLWAGLGFTETSRDAANVVLRWRYSPSGLG